MSDKVKAAAELIAGVYEHHGAGGGLHVVLDDWNIEDSTVAFCQNYIETPEYRANDEVTSDRLGAERNCVHALKTLTEEERGSALALYDGFVKA